MNVLPEEEKRQLIEKMKETEVEQYNTRNDSHM